MKFFLLHFSFPLALGLIFSNPSDAQVANFGRSPNLNVITPGTSSSSSTFAPTNGWTCPHPSFSMGAFGASGSDWSNDFTTYNSSGSGIINYGIAAGVTVPFTGEFSIYCKDYAKSLAERTRIEMEGIRRNDQISLLQQCYWLLQNKIKIDQPAFMKPEGPFSSLRACDDYDFEPAQGGGGTIKVPEKPPTTRIEPNPASNLILQKSP